MSHLGIAHTVIGVLAILAGAWSYVCAGKISTQSLAGKFYILGTIIACLTAFGLSRSGKFNEGHVLSLLTLMVVGMSVIIKNKYVRVLGLTVSFFLSFIPTTVETLTRLPVGSPWASGPADQIVKNALGVVTLVFVAGALYQLLRLKKNKLS